MSSLDAEMAENRHEDTAAVPEQCTPENILTESETALFYSACLSKY
jgi:hypothetical protein